MMKKILVTIQPFLAKHKWAIGSFLLLVILVISVLVAYSIGKKEGYSNCYHQLKPTEETITMDLVGTWERVQSDAIIDHDPSVVSKMEFDKYGVMRAYYGNDQITHNYEDNHNGTLWFDGKVLHGRFVKQGNQILWEIKRNKHYAGIYKKVK